MPSPAQAGAARSRAASLVPPKSLAALLGIVLIAGLAWALTVAPWQSPDEVAHFAYVQSIAETFTLPGEKGRPAISSDQSVADAAVGGQRGAFFPGSSPPNWSRADWNAYLRATDGATAPSRSNGSGPNPASSNPPLYYLFAAAGYLTDHSGTTFGRLYAIRIEGVLLLLASTVAAWLLAGETFGRRRLPQLACAAVVGLLPMNTFISTSVNPDAPMVTLWTFALWLGARVINRRAQTFDAVALCAVTAAGILTKATSYALVLPVVLALLIGWRRRPASERRSTLTRVLAAGLLLVVPVIGWLALAHALGRSGINTIASTPGAPSFNPTQFLSYLWQFYLPKLSFLTTFPEAGPLPLYDVWIRQTTGVFGWLDADLPGWLYVVSTIVAAVIAIAALGLVTRLRQSRHLALLAFFALMLIALLGLLHITDYRSIIAGQGPIVQGRYLLPLVGLAGLAVGLIVARLAPRMRPLASGAVLTAMLATQAISLATVVHAYYL
jgi:4-amino-4-deoxy-L-arabinose transferase-like glycosyltransferase